jgi:hypothetical protein
MCSSATTGGQPPGPRGQIEIMAAYDGKGALNAVLSVQTTAQADGSFELSGLTVGTCKIQAVLDRIWLSPTIEVQVGQHNPPAVELAIGATAGPIEVMLTVAKGQPLCGREVRLDRPAGPYSALWPRVLLSDGARRVQIPVLEAGVHKLRVCVRGASPWNFSIDQKST